MADDPTQDPDAYLRQAYMARMLGVDPGAILPDEQAKALADRLKAHQDLAMIGGAFSGNPGIANMGQIANQQANTEERGLLQNLVAQQRAKAMMAGIGARHQGRLEEIGAQQEGAGQRADLRAQTAKDIAGARNNAALNVAGIRTGRGLLAPTGNQAAPAVPRTAPTATAWTPSTPTEDNPLADVPPDPDVRADPKRGQQVHKMMMDLNKVLSPWLQVRSAYGQAANTLRGVLSAKPLLEGGNNLSQLQTNELANVLNRILTGGSGITLEQIHNLTPQSYKGKLNEWIGKVINEPKGLEQEAFIAQLANLVDREGKVQMDAITQQQKKMLPSFQVLYNTAPHMSYNAIAASAGPDVANEIFGVKKKLAAVQGAQTPAAPPSAGAPGQGAALPQGPATPPAPAIRDFTGLDGKKRRTANGETRVWTGKAWVKE